MDKDREYPKRDPYDVPPPYGQQQGCAEAPIPTSIRRHEVNPFLDMRSFMRMCGDELPHLSHHSGELSSQVSRYVRLCDEELGELHEALAMPTRDLGEVMKRVELIGDAATDLIYVAIGVMHSLGIPAEEFWSAVHSSNLSKVDYDGKVQRRFDGKILKPSHYRAPDLQRTLALALANDHPDR